MQFSNFAPLKFTFFNKVAEKRQFLKVAPEKLEFFKFVPKNSTLKKRHF